MGRLNLSGWGGPADQWEVGDSDVELETNIEAGDKDLRNLIILWKASGIMHNYLSEHF